MADVPGYYRPVWFHPGGIANILSLINVKAKYHVTYDNRNGDSPNQFCVHKENGDQRRFKQSQQGLYYLDTASSENHTVLAVSTVENNKSKYADRDYTRATLARKIQILVGRPELKDFLRYIEGNSLPNCPITRQDAINAHHIFGRDVGPMKGKTTRSTLPGIRANLANILKAIMAQYCDITLCIDIMFVNKIPFFLSISRDIRFITAAVLPNRQAPSLIKALKDINGVYRQLGFRITVILGDSEFECTCGSVAGDLHSDLNICGEEEHVPDIERCIRAIKERTRCTYTMAPFEHFPPGMIIEVVFLAVFWLNGFPHKLGISQTFSPRTIVTGLSIDYNKHCRIEYGQYEQTHKKHDNTMTTRTIGALALRPTGNQQGGYYFYSLMSGQRLHRTHWTELPMPAKVTTRVHALPRRANASRGPTFTNSHGNGLDLLYPGDDDDDADSDYDPAHDDDDDDNSSTSSDDSGDASTDLSAAPNPAELAGVNEPVNITGVADTTPGVDIRTPGVAGETSGVTEIPELKTPELQEYVNELEAELDAEIAGLDSDCSPENKSDTEDDDLHDSFTPINHDKVAAANAHAA
jgi:hypothetical protein